MAITIAPVLQTINSFDATQDYNIKFTINGINIKTPFTVTATIKDNATNELVFTGSLQINSIDKLYYTILANTLTNNKYYKCYINISDGSSISPSSNTVSFYCISKPIFQFVNIPFTLNISELIAILQYEQTGNIADPLNSYIVRVYNSHNEIVFDSNTQYVASLVDSIQVKITALDEDSYTIVALGETRYGMQLSTEEHFTVQYNAPTAYSSMYLDNLYDRGQIRITSNIIALLGHLEPDKQPTFVDGAIKLTDEDLVFDKGFNINKDFYLKIWMKDIQTNTRKAFLEISDKTGENKISAFWRSAKYQEFNGQLKSFIELQVRNLKSNLCYVIHSNYIDGTPNADDMYFIGLKKKDDLYKVHTEKGAVPSKGV